MLQPYLPFLQFVKSNPFIPSLLWEPDTFPKIPKFAYLISTTWYLCDKTSFALGTWEREQFLNPKIMNCKSDFEELIIPRRPAPGGGTRPRESKQFAIFRWRPTAAAGGCRQMERHSFAGILYTHNSRFTLHCKCSVIPFWQCVWH